MAFDVTKMRCAVPEQRRWIYSSGADNVAGPNYFDAFAKNLRVLDVIESVPDAGTPIQVSVVSITDGVVVVA